MSSVSKPDAFRAISVNGQRGLGLGLWVLRLVFVCASAIRGIHAWATGMSEARGAANPMEERQHQAVTKLAPMGRCQDEEPKW